MKNQFQIIIRIWLRRLFNKYMLNKLAILFIIFLSTDLAAESVYYINASSVRLRDKPSLSSNIVELLRENETVKWTGEKSKNSFIIDSKNNTKIEGYFYKVITSNENTGWVFSYYLTEEAIFIKELDPCTRSIPGETVHGINKLSHFNRENLSYFEKFKIKNVNYSIKNNGCDTFSQIITIEGDLDGTSNDNSAILHLTAKSLILLKDYYLKDFDLNKVIYHLKKKNIQFNLNYDFNSGKQIIEKEGEEFGYRFSIQEPIIKKNKIYIEVVLSSGLL
ncbi:SH3 domain-containing protein [Leptospira sp. GIMC2001]|uniref:SH3 domain-containing protein n=1 Tax=Leptospira sp. GIMC2001 TaxID=1513297 RepID=UPI00234A506F|nr:SH3 domain-containing protein [Leptospira sp. GIMC2001]WCL51009.1 SH3 domain-containing protein [Leptospira sp. GIMC2001]